MTEVHRYSVVKMLSEGGNRISYDPYGPEVVMASAYDQLKADNERVKAELKKVDADRKACWAEFKVQGRQLDQLKAENEALRKDSERLQSATAFVQKLCDAAVKQPSVATGYLHDILSAMGKEEQS